MNINQALRATQKDLKWSPAHFAATAGVSEGAARKWLDDRSVPAGDTLLRLMAAIPELRVRLGYDLREAA